MKHANRTMLLMGIPAILLLLAGILLLWGGGAVLDSAEAMARQATDTGGQTPGDVEGYAMLAGLAGAGMGGLAGLAAQLFGMLLILYGGGVLLFSGIARLILDPGRKRLPAYRVLMGIACVIALLPVPELLKTFGRALWEGTIQPLPLAAAAAVCVIVFFSGRNTYTDRIFS